MNQYLIYLIAWSIFNILFFIANLIQFINYIRYSNFYHKIKYDNKYGNFKKKEKVTINNQVFEILYDDGNCLYLKTYKESK